MKLSYKFFYRLCLPLISLLAWSPSPATADDGLSIRQIRPMNFGTIVATDGVCALDFSGNLYGNSGCVSSSNTSAARFIVAGEQWQLVNVHVTPTTQTIASGVTFKPYAQRSSYRLNRQGRKRFNVRGELIMNDPTPGEHNFSYVIHVDYQ